MRQDFSTVPDTETDLVTVPPGRYLCRVRDVHVRRTKDGAFPQWALVLEVADGEHAGHLGAWDNLTFSERGLPRVKLALRALGFDVSGVLELEADALRGRRTVVDLVESEYVHPASGHVTRRLVVPYAGYAHATSWGEGTGAAGAEPDPLDGDDEKASGASDTAAGGGGPGTAAARSATPPF